jgi:peroxiredoxin
MTEEVSRYDLYRGVGGNLPVNAPAPDFTLLDGDAKPFKLSDQRGKNIVLAFYPADWSPVCTNELALFQETLDKIRNYNAEIVGISVDSHYSHRAWAEKLHVTFPLLSDFWPHGAVSQQYAVFQESDGVSRRSLFFVDGTGMLRDAWIAEDQSIAPSLSQVFHSLEGIQQGSLEAAQHV